MIKEISQRLQHIFNSFPSEDRIIFNNKLFSIDKNNFEPIIKAHPKSMAFVDGGQAEIISAGSFCLSFIRVAALVYRDNKKIKDEKSEFYLLTTAKYQDEEIVYESKIFPKSRELPP